MYATPLDRLWLGSYYGKYKANKGIVVVVVVVVVVCRCWVESKMFGLLSQLSSGLIYF